MTPLQAAIGQLRARIDERNLRERLLLLAAVVVVLFLFWDLAVRAPIAERAETAKERIGQLERELPDLKDSERTLRAELESLTDDTTHAEREQALRERIADLDERLAERTARVISPQEMVTVLRDMVAGDDALTLESLHNEGVEEVIAEDRDEGIPRVFRHRVQVVATGDYFALLDYLKRLEGLDWQFQWDALRLETTDYPRARVTIALSTLSLDEGWIRA